MICIRALKVMFMKISARSFPLFDGHSLGLQWISEVSVRIS